MATRAAATPSRRGSDVQVAHLEGRMDMLEQRFDQRFDQVEKTIASMEATGREILAEVKQNSDRFHKIELENAVRSSRLELIEQRVEIGAQKPTTTTTTTTTSQEDGTIDRWRKTAISALIVALCILGVIYIAVDIRSMLKSSVVHTSEQLLEHAP